MYFNNTDETYFIYNNIGIRITEDKLSIDHDFVFYFMDLFEDNGSLEVIRFINKKIKKIYG